MRRANAVPQSGAGRSNGAAGGGSARGCDVVKIGFGLAALLCGLLNFALVVLSPLFQLDCDLEAPALPGASRRLSKPGAASLGRGRVSEAWSCLEPVNFDSLRLLPDSELEAAARQKPRWLVFGLSSVHRKQAEYLGITLSHLFDALGDSTDTGLVVHLADFDETWVTRMRDWLSDGFQDEVQANRLHVIHAPEKLYPAKEEIFKNTKYGDPPLRQWWRAKQNLDYAFLMWYAAGLAEYYMQLEDDVQVTPNFLPTVRKYMKEKLTGDAWVMVAFSKLGFIGKLFDSERLPKLAEFLLVYHAEAPCDWLVWIFIDAVSSQPVTALIPQDLEDEFTKRENAKKNPTVKLPKAMRTDVLMYYKDRKPVFLSTPVKVSEKVTVAPSPLDSKSPFAEPPRPAAMPSARVFSTMEHWQQYSPGLALGANNKRGFWSSDTCHPTRKTAACTPDSKYLELVFDQPLKLGLVKLAMGASDHPQDYIRNGTLEAGFQLSKDQTVCEGYSTLTWVRNREVVWSGTLLRPVKCLRVRLLETQQEWVMMRFEDIQQEAGASTTLAEPAAMTSTGAPSTPPMLPTPPAEAAQPVPMVPAATSSTTLDVVETTTQSTTDAVNSTHWMPRLSRHGLLHLNLEALRNEDHKDMFSTMLASSAGLLAGLAGWVSVLLCGRISLEGTALVGQFPCWISSFLPLIDSLLFTSLNAPELPVSCDQGRKLAGILPAFQTMHWWSDLPKVEMSPVVPTPRRLSETRWTDLFSPARHLAWKLQEIVVLGQLPSPKKWLTVAMRTSGAEGEAHELAQVIQKLFLAAGDANFTVLVHLSDPISRWTEELSSFQSELEAGKLLAVRAPEKFYAAAPARLQYELAVMFAAAGALSDFYVQVEADVVAEQGFVKMLQDYVLENDKAIAPTVAPVPPGPAGPPGPTAATRPQWNLVALGRDGLHRKVMRSEQLMRFAELLVIFPEVPPDSLIWDYVDVINNQSAPKACYIAFSATKIKRQDVLLQYHKAEAIIEHVGDVSSLEGKVQRIHDDYFKKHNLLSTLFNNPAADIYAGGNLDFATQAMLQGIYGVHGNSPSMGGAPAVNMPTAAMADLAGKAVLEVVFRKSTSVQMLNLRMGGFLRPQAKNKKQPELADPDFAFVFPDAELSVGRAKGPSSNGLRGKVSLPASGFCSVYQPLINFSGREVFWRSPTSRPELNVDCIKVTLWEAPKTSVIIRTIRVRSDKSLPARRLQTQAEEGRAAAGVKHPTWQAEMKSWAQKVSVAFGAGGLAGALGLAVTALPWLPSSKSRRRTKVSQSE